MKIDQYAALPWRRRADGTMEVLLITSRETKRWVIPKGWPMAGRAPHEAAAQEAWEEAGVRGEISDVALGDYGYLKRLKGHQVRPLGVEVFALEVAEELDDWPERHERTRAWMTPAAAADEVREMDLASLIRRFGGVPATPPTGRPWRRLWRRFLPG